MKVTWPQVTLILGTMALFFATLIILTKLQVDAAAIMTTCVLLLLSVLGVLGYRSQGELREKVDQVKELSNGRITELNARNEQLQTQVTEMALRLPPPPEAKR
jgi:uncharacterized membrane protein